MSKLKPKILHVYFSHSASGYRPGWARFDILTEMFRRKGYEAWILGYKMKWSSLKQKLFGGIEIDKNSKVINLIIPHWLSTIDVFLNNLFLIGGFGWSILLALISNRIKPNTIILTDDTIGTNFYFLLIKKILQKKINIIIDYQDLTAQMHTCKSKNIFKKLISQTIDEVINPRLAKKLIVISKFGKDYLMQRSNVKDIYVIPAIAESKNLDNYSKEECRRLFNIPLNYKVIIWSGFIEGFTTKDVLFLIDAISLCKHKNEIMLVMIGGGIEYDRYYILNHAKRKGVNAMHLGYFDSNKAEYWLCLRSADIGILDFLDNNHCLYADGFDEYIKSLLELYFNKELRKLLKINLRNKAQDIITPNIAKVLYKIINA